MKVISLKKILIVEDDDSIHKLIKELLIDKYEILDVKVITEDESKEVDKDLYNKSYDMFKRI